MAAMPNAIQYFGLSNAALPPVTIKSERFMAISITTMLMKDIENAVVNAKRQLKFSRTFRMMVSNNTEVQSPATIAKDICTAIDVSG